MTSFLGHDLLSGIFGRLGLALLLLHVGQLLYRVRLCAHAGSVAADCLTICELGLGSRGGFLLGRRNLRLFFALDRFGRILALGSPLLLCSSGPRFLGLALFRCARVFLVLDRDVAFGLQFVVGPLLLLGRRLVELGRAAKPPLRSVSAAPRFSRSGSPSILPTVASSIPSQRS